MSRTERWVGFVFVALTLLGALINTKFFFAGGIVFCVAFGIGTIRAIIQQFRENPHRGVLSRILEAIPLTSVLLFACALIYLLLHELLRVRRG